MRRLSQPVHTGSNLLLVQEIKAGDMVASKSGLFRVVWVEHGQECGGRTLYVLPPTNLRGTPIDIQQKGYLLQFPEEFLLMLGLQDLYPFVSMSTLPGAQSTSVELTDCKIGRTMERIIASLHIQWRQLPQGHLRLSGLLKILLVSVARLIQQPDPVESSCGDQQLFQRFMSLIAKHDVSKKGMHEYARQLSIRTEVLSETIKRVSGYPASHHIYQHVIRTAKQAAIGSGSTMKEVAFGLGFKDVAHFSKFFRNKAGMTFSDYKKAYQAL